MGKLSFFNSRKKPKSAPPWGNFPSIFDHIKKNIDSSGKLNEEGLTLPDSGRLVSHGGLKWADGARDGVAAYHIETNHGQEKAARTAALIDKIARDNDGSAKFQIYELCVKDGVIDYLDETIEKIVEFSSPVYPHLYEFVQWLVRKSPDREPLKFGLALLGLIGNESDLEDVVIAGKHEEFTLYSAVAVVNLLEEPDVQLWEMAKNVGGWGRIHLVDRLVDTKNQDVKSWLLLEGYKNEVMYEYLAYTCAVAGDLHAALSKPVISLDLLASAGDLIGAMVCGGPAEDIDMYEHAAQDIRNYLKHLEPNISDLTHLLTVSDILEFLNGSDEEWTERYEIGWTEGDRREIAAIAGRIIDNPVWPKLVEETLNPNDEEAFWNTIRAAEILRIDIWDTLWRRLKESPHAPDRWYHVMKNANAERIDAIVDLAGSVLPIDEIATGPADELGLGLEYNLHSCLDIILVELAKYPGRGFHLLEAGIKSPVIRNRNMALNSLSSWGTDNWPEGTKALLEQSVAAEPDEDVKERMMKVLKGGKIRLY